MEGKSRKPGRPGRPFPGGSRRPRPGMHCHGIEGPFSGQQDDQQNRGEVTDNKDQVKDHQIDQHQHGHVQEAGGFLSQHHGQRPDPLLTVFRGFIDVFADINADHAQPKGMAARATSQTESTIPPASTR